GINLDDGGSLMAFRIRSRDGAALWGHVAWRDAGGRLRHPAGVEVRFEPLRWWRSARSGGRYPIEALVTVMTTPRRRVRLVPLIDDQEIDARASTGGHYWEGAVRALDADTGASLGRGYHELTGYAEPLAL
ncbi:MAG: lipocalin family protein, partial [Burkholderiales bacterium]